jgi:glutamate carboxypeptidase
VVPNLALVDGEARFIGQDETADLAGDLSQLAVHIAKEHGVRIKFDVGKVVPPMDPAGREAGRPTQAVQWAAKRGWTLQLEKERGGISFPNFLPDPGAIPVLDGLGPIGDGMHTREEYLLLSSLDRRIRLLADLLAEDAAAQG